MCATVPGVILTSIYIHGRVIILYKLLEEIIKEMLIL